MNQEKQIGLFAETTNRDTSSPTQEYCGECLMVHVGLIPLNMAGECNCCAIGHKSSEEQTPKTPNAYELRQERRRERLERAATRARKYADAHKATADRMASVIPFGQPILVGHYSEKADRRYRARIHGHMDKWVSETRQAEELERQAESVGTAGISSDDPESVHKLRAQLASCEALQERMKAGNKIVRDRSLTDEQKVLQLEAIGLSHENAWRALKPDFCGRIGFPDYALKNNNANMRRISQRIAVLSQRSQQADAQPVTGNGFQITEDGADNRILITFDDKPAETTRAMLKSMGWRWSPMRNRLGADAQRCGQGFGAVCGRKIEQLDRRKLT